MHSDPNTRQLRGAQVILIQLVDQKIPAKGTGPLSKFMIDLKGIFVIMKPYIYQSSFLLLVDIP